MSSSSMQNLEKKNSLHGNQNENEAGGLLKNENEDVFKSPTTPTQEHQTPGMS